MANVGGFMPSFTSSTRSVSSVDANGTPGGSSMIDFENLFSTDFLSDFNPSNFGVAPMSAPLLVVDTDGDTSSRQFPQAPPQGYTSDMGFGGLGIGVGSLGNGVGETVQPVVQHGNVTAGANGGVVDLPVGHGVGLGAEAMAQQRRQQQWIEQQKKIDAENKLQEEQRIAEEEQEMLKRRTILTRGISGGSNSGDRGSDSNNNLAAMSTEEATPANGARRKATANAKKRKASDPPKGKADDTPETIASRRLRNREHAKRSRVRKKFLLESLQVELKELQKENTDLRCLVRETCGAAAADILRKECATNPLFDEDKSESSGQHDSTDAAASEDPLDNKIRPTLLDRQDLTLMSSLSLGQQNFVLSDPRLPDNPIVFASEGFYKLTGYSPEQVLGRNCRFLQGPGTDPRAVDVLRKAIASGQDATVCLLNYKEDGEPFWNQFFVAALRDANNNVVNYVGVQTLVNAPSEKKSIEQRVDAVLPLKR